MQWRGKGKLPACTKLMGNSFSMAALIPGAGRRGVGGAGWGRLRGWLGDRTNAQRDVEGRKKQNGNKSSVGQ